MTRQKFLRAALAALCLGLPAQEAAAEIMVADPYARAATANAPTGAAFMVLMNHGTHDDRLIAARSPAAARVELHSHDAGADGVMRMGPIAGGIPLPAGGSHILARGGDHLMFLGLTRPFEQGARIPLTLVFEKAGEITLEIPVDLTRKPGAEVHGGHGGHGGMAKE